MTEETPLLKAKTGFTVIKGEDDVYRIIPNLNTELDLSEAQPISLFDLKSACRELVAVLDRNDVVAAVRALFTPSTPPTDDNSESQAS
jgi:hypothetical protein